MHRYPCESVSLNDLARRLSDFVPCWVIVKRFQASPKPNGKPPGQPGRKLPGINLATYWCRISALPGVFPPLVLLSMPNAFLFSYGKLSTAASLPKGITLGERGRVPSTGEQCIALQPFGTEDYQA